MTSHVNNRRTLTDRVVKYSENFNNNCSDLYSRARVAHPFGSIAIEFQAAPEIYDVTRR